MKKITSIVAILLSLVMVASLAACGSTQPAETTAAAPETQAQESSEEPEEKEETEAESETETEAEVEEAGTLMAGAGSAAIKFVKEMFTETSTDSEGNTKTGQLEGFSGEIESDPYVRVLLIEDGEKAALISMELVNIPADVITAVRDMVSEKADIPVENVWVHANHTITTPHSSRSDENVNALYAEAVENAAESAVDDAVKSFQPAKLGVGEGTLDINTNRNVKADNGEYFIGDECADTLEGSNKELSIVRFDSLSGDPIGMAISYGMKPTTIDNAEMSEGTRKISSDLTGLACVKMEEEFDCPVMFVMPASGDQEAKKTTNYFEWGVDERSGQETYVQKYQSVEYGIELVKEYGQTMFETCSKVAESITCDEKEAAVVIGETAFDYKNNNGEDAGSFEVSGLMIGDKLAFIGLKPEVDAVTEKALWDASPVEHTLLVSFLNGDGKYMPHKEAYTDPKTVEGKKAGYAEGTAETFVDTAVSLLDTLASGK